MTLLFEERPKSNQPRKYLHYYRLRNNLTTRQLAEQVGIVPATLLKYEQGLNPIPYDTAVRLSEQLRSDAELLYDSFANFIATPYTEALKAIREKLKLN
ncbi:helix-turn-helix domain-containing protein [Mordavella massiliensis]|uniref:helix-turn-helix domain-containing protein n=1 Tax=Mordavella massiliensis TaxID=1871024 RepID=UPI00210AABED|nr:helix-turn-helix domain-containing protein [Mordavella massiliensis]